MRWVYDNIAALAVSVVLLAFAWIYGGIVKSAIAPVMPWLFAFLFEAMLCFPQRKPGETTVEARERVWETLKHDPITWIVLVFWGLLIIALMNKGLCPTCDYPAIVGGADPAPPLPFAPYCVNRSEHYGVMLWFFPGLLAVLAARHALLKRGKRMVLLILTWSGMLLALLGLIQQTTGAVGPWWTDMHPRWGKMYFFSTFGYANMGGAYFSLMFAIGAAAWRWQIEEVESQERDREEGHGTKIARGQVFWHKHLLLVPALCCFFAALATLSRAAILMSVALATVFSIHSIICFFARMKRVARVKNAAFAALIMVAIAICAVLFTPEELQHEVDHIQTNEVLNRVSGKFGYHNRVAAAIWRDNVLFGCGGWGYKHFCIQKLSNRELRHLQTEGGVNVHNDYLQFMAEHGIVGFGCLVAIVLLLLRPIFAVWGTLGKTARFLPPRERPPMPVMLFALPAGGFFILVGALCVGIHAFGDCPLRSPAVFSSLLVALSCAEGYLPRVN